MAPTELSPDLAPAFRIPERDIVAVEHPMIIRNIDNGLKTLGTGMPLHQVVNPDEENASMPIYLRPQDPTCGPILSQNVASSNVVLKIVVPKRTGRRRRRGSQGPFVEADHKTPPGPIIGLDNPASEVSSHSRVDQPSTLRRILQDNISGCKIEAIGTISQTHRFKGLADFHYSTAHATFMNKVQNTMMTGDLDKIKQFRFDPSRGPKPLDEIVPPPSFTEHNIPYNWAYKQNNQITTTTDPTTGQKVLYNSSKPKRIYTCYIPSNTPMGSVPTGPKYPPPAEDFLIASLIKKISACLDERPMWSRRALSNRMGHTEGMYLFKECLQYVCYQFRGGPWRDAVIKFGVDPRADPKYRIYQTLFFKIFDGEFKNAGKPLGKGWNDIRSEYTRKIVLKGEEVRTHIFDGKTVHLDGKLWQICDITDSLCLRILENGQLREECDTEVDGWYCNGTLGKLKAVMRAKISAIRVGKVLEDKEFEDVGTLAYPEEVTDRRYINVPVPDWTTKKDGVDGTRSHNGGDGGDGMMAASSPLAETIEGDGGDDDVEEGGQTLIKTKVYKKRENVRKRKPKFVPGDTGMTVINSGHIQQPAGQQSEGQSPMDPRVLETMNALEIQRGFDRGAGDIPGTGVFNVAQEEDSGDEHDVSDEEMADE